MVCALPGGRVNREPSDDGPCKAGVGRDWEGQAGDELDWDGGAWPIVARTGGEGRFKTAWQLGPPWLSLPLLSQGERVQSSSRRAEINKAMLGQGPRMRRDRAQAISPSPANRGRRHTPSPRRDSPARTGDLQRKVRFVISSRKGGLPWEVRATHPHQQKKSWRLSKAVLRPGAGVLLLCWPALPILIARRERLHRHLPPSPHSQTVALCPSSASSLSFPSDLLSLLLFFN